MGDVLLGRFIPGLVGDFGTGLRTMGVALSEAAESTRGCCTGAMVVNGGGEIGGDKNNGEPKCEFIGGGDIV